MQAGNLTDRAQLDGFEGLDREMLVEVNSLLDALITPLTIASDRLRRLAKGEIPPKISESFSGDLDRMKADINACIDQLSTQSVG
jgi:methyl-accepting chemotaxis protein